jgi:hypothetical protein
MGESKNGQWRDNVNIRHPQCYLYTFSQDILDTAITHTNVITQYVVIIPTLHNMT